MATEMKLITDITLELTGETKRYEVVAKQGDKATRFIRITLKNNGQDFEIPAGMKVIANIQKPDRKCCYNTCSYSGSTVTMELTNQALAVAGTAECDIEIRDANDEVVLSSQAFTIEIEKSMRDENAIRSSNEFTQLEQDIREYAEKYFEENPVSGMTEEQEEQLSTNTQDIKNLKINLSDKLNNNQGVENKGKAMMVGDNGILFPSDIKAISTKLKNAILNCFLNVAWSNENGQVYYNELKEALELIKTMSLLYKNNVTVKAGRIYSDMGNTLIGGSGNVNGRAFVSDLFEEDATIKVTLIPSVTCWNFSCIGITKIDEWENEFSTMSTGYIYNATKFSSMTVDMEYTITLNVKAGYQVIFFVGGTNTAEPKIEVVGAVEE